MHRKDINYCRNMVLRLRNKLTQLWEVYIQPTQEFQKVIQQPQVKFQEGTQCSAFQLAGKPFQFYHQSKYFVIKKKMIWNQVTQMTHPTPWAGTQPLWAYFLMGITAGGVGRRQYLSHHSCWEDHLNNLGKITFTEVKPKKVFHWSVNIGNFYRR